ncbi:MAG: hypothetical protein KF826_13240 [Xanthobacteraceae bacterium]|nr:hypothetical protein [Xanthobacteraceae bacterium]MBX3548387.1 hypothetical protein [Xanthobacteraceae bacterium]
MRSLTAARLVLLDFDSIRSEALARALIELGSFEIARIATIAEAAAAGAADLFLIEGPSLAANDEGAAISPNPFSACRAPVILMLPEPTNEQRRMALRAGYTAVLSTPVPPRLLYRRIAQLLQNARRARRRSEEMLARGKRAQQQEQATPNDSGLVANAAE